MTQQNIVVEWVAFALGIRLDRKYQTRLPSCPPIGTHPRTMREFLVFAGNGEALFSWQNDKSTAQLPRQAFFVVSEYTRLARSHHARTARQVPSGGPRTPCLVERSVAQQK